MSAKPRPGETFEEWFDRQPALPNFTGAEIAIYFDRFRYRNGVKHQNTTPPKSLWPRFIPVIRIAQKIRSHFGKPVTITSSYRNNSYNKAVGGAYRSQHKEFRAIDLKVRGVAAGRVAEYALELRRAGEFKGGIGRYSTFTHIDTRGTNATWG